MAGQNTVGEKSIPQHAATTTTTSVKLQVQGTIALPCKIMTTKLAIICWAIIIKTEVSQLRNSLCLCLWIKSSSKLDTHTRQRNMCALWKRETCMCLWLPWSFCLSWRLNLRSSVFIGRLTTKSIQKMPTSNRTSPRYVEHTTDKMQENNYIISNRKRKRSSFRKRVNKRSFPWSKQYFHHISMPAESMLN